MAKLSVREYIVRAKRELDKASNVTTRDLKEGLTARETDTVDACIDRAYADLANAISALDNLVG